MEIEKKPLLQVIENKTKSEAGVDRGGEERPERADALSPGAVQTTLLKERIAQRERELVLVREAVRSEQLLRVTSEKELIRLQEQLKYQQARFDFEKTGIEQTLDEKKAESQDLERLLAAYRLEIAGIRRQLAEVVTAGRMADEELLTMNDRLARGEAALLSAREETEQRVGEIAGERALLERTIVERERQVKKGEDTLEKVLAEKEDALARLGDANLKYRAATERIDQYKELVAQEQERLESAREELHKEQLRRLDQDRALETKQATLIEAQQKYALVCEQSALLRKRIDALDAERQETLLEQERLKHLHQEQFAAQTQSLKETQAAVKESGMRYRNLFQQSTEQRERIAGNEAAAKQSARQQERLENDLAEIRKAYLESQYRAFSLQGSVSAGHYLQAQLQNSLGTLQSALSAADSKYRTLSEQAGALRELLAQAEGEVEKAQQTVLVEQAQRRTREAELAALQGELVAADRKYDVISGQAGALRELLAQAEGEVEKAQQTRSELETERARSRDMQLQSEQMKLQLLQGKQQLAATTAQVERLRQQKLTAENQIIKTRATLSFQLGYLLIHGFKSFKAIKSLPGQLVALHRESRRRKTGKAPVKDQVKEKEKEKPAPRVTLPQSSKVCWSTVTPGTGILPRPGPSLPTTALPPALDFAATLKELRVAAIMDEFTFGSYQHECNLLALTPQSWQQELEAFTPELLFIESAWRGKDDLWGNKVGHKSDELVGIVAWCRDHQVPTAFWNKEDPVHFETFLHTAQLFDFVFTTDIDCIHRYKGALGHERVYLLPFACQPLTTNPLAAFERKDAFSFAGAYYLRYPERTRDLGNFVSTLATYRPVEIFDRNFGKEDPNYQFPAEYRPFIVGHLPYDQIDRAYKGYRYAINLNSIKQSQSMFARRVFDLLASNTLTVSNFSRGVRLLFGDLVITTDNGEEIVQRLQAINPDEKTLRKFTLAGLRKVMQEHTYQDRLAYLVAKVQGLTAIPPLLPTLVVTAYAKNQEQFAALYASFSRQSYQPCRLLVVLRDGFTPAPLPDDPRIELLSQSASDGVLLAEILADNTALCAMVPDDYYGANYLLDLALATRYSRAEIIGKGTHYLWSATAGLSLVADGEQYRSAARVAARSSLVKGGAVAALSLREWVGSLYTRQFESDDLLAIDEFNYCKNGQSGESMPPEVATVNDLEGLNSGVSVRELINRAEKIAPAKSTLDTAPTLSGAEFAAYFPVAADKKYKLTTVGTLCEVESLLADGTHDYLYSTIDLDPAELGYTGGVKFHLDVTPGLNLQMVILFLDAQGQRIGNIVKSANCNQEAALPVGTATLRLGLRLYGAGSARINALVLGHRPLQPALVIEQAEHLLLTNNYPAYDDLYRNAFVHSRVLAYRAAKTRVDVFRLRSDEALNYHEYQDVDVITGSQEALQKLLAGGRYKSILVHFLDAAMWQVLEKEIGKIPVLVWVHGFEIQPWHRRDFNLATEAQRDAAKIKSQTRMDFWNKLLQPMPANLKLVFVSQYLADVVMEDLGFKLPAEQYSVIHNAIDTDLFVYQEKSAEQRKKILSIRPYASRLYANDLSVQAILALKDQPWFDELEFRIIGDGKLFEETLAPLRSLKNVYIEQRFLGRTEIAALHQEYGIFLCPSRLDTQGVSRDEAMASGLVPVTNRVAAIPEFVDETCGILVEPEDSAGLAAGIAQLYRHPREFLELSRAASARVSRQSSVALTIARELELFRGETPPLVEIARSGDAPGSQADKMIGPVSFSTNPGRSSFAPGDAHAIHSFLSFDVEALPGRAAENDFERLVWGRAGGEEFGLRRICAILRQYQIKGNFMVDLASARLYGDGAVQKVIDFLLSEGHEVHTHLHSEWVVRHWGLDKFGLDFAPFDQLDYDLTRRLLDFSAWKYRLFTGKEGTVFRPGGFLFNRQTLLAAKDAGFKAISSFNRERHQGIFSLDQSSALTEPFTWDNGLIELPVDLSPEPLSMPFSTYLGAFDRVERKKNKTFNLVLHSWSLAKRDQFGYHPAFTPEHEDRLHQICQHLQSVGTLCGYDHYLQQERAQETVPIELCRDSSRIILTRDLLTCTVCGAMVTAEILGGDICPGCGARARHRQLLDLFRRTGNPFVGKTVIACHATPMEKQAFLEKAASVFNFDVRPVSYVDQQMDIQEMGAIATGSFDGFFALHVLNHVKDDKRALAEIARVLKPQGLAVLTVPYRENEATSDCADITEHYGADALEKFAVGSYRRYGKNDFVALLEEHFSVSVDEGIDVMTGHAAKIFMAKKRE